MMKVSRGTAETILIFRIGSLGDTVVALPCFHRIAQSFPQARRIVITDFPASDKATSPAQILGNSGLVDGVIYFPPPPRKPRDILKLRGAIRAANATTLVYVADRDRSSVVRDMLFFRLCGITRVIGASLDRGLLQRRRDAKTGIVEREAERLARCMAPLGAIDLHDPRMWDLRLQPDERVVAERALRPLGGQAFIALSVGAKVARKDWGDDNWGALLRKMAARHPQYALALFGSDDEAARSARLAAHWPGRTLNLCGRLSPRESAAALSGAALFIGHDSGPLHLAAAVGARCVGLYGDTNRPNEWHPSGGDTRIIHAMRGVRQISPDEVCAAVDAQLARGTRASAHHAAE